jgi:glycosyltransferase involved in cell wall biosynthesis
MRTTVPAENARLFRSNVEETALRAALVKLNPCECVTQDEATTANHNDLAAQGRTHMRILMVSDFYPPFLGGVEVFVSSVSRELVLRGHEVAVATLLAPGLPASDTDAGVRVHRIRTTTQRAGRLFASQARPWAPPAPDPEAVAGLRSIVAVERPDVVHGHDWLARSYLPLKRRGRGPAFVMSLHYYTLTCAKKNLMYDGAPCSGPALAKCVGCAGRHYGTAKGAGVALGQLAFSRLEAARVDLFLPVSEATASGNGLPRPGLAHEVVLNFIAPEPDPAPYAQLLEELPAQPFLLFVGDVRRDKGAQTLLEAYRELREPPPLVLIGKIWRESPREFPPGVTLLRDWPNPAVRAAMRRCLAVVAPSIWPEPCPLAVVEALAAGRPVVASAIGGIPELVRDRREGLLVAPGDVAALTLALEEVCRDEQLRETLAANAVRRADRHTPDAVLPRFEAAYERVASARR